MNSTETSIRLIKAKKNIKRKLAALKANKLLTQEHFKTTYTPLTQSIRDIITSIPHTTVKIEPADRDIKRESEITPGLGLGFSRKIRRNTKRKHKKKKKKKEKSSLL